MEQKMKTTLSLVLVFTFLLIGAGVVSAQPKMVIPNPEFDFGYVPQHSKITHKFWMHSTGSDTLKIVNVRPGCGCTKAPLEKSELAVGDSTYVEVIYSTKTYRGKQSKRPSITTNMGTAPMRVNFTAEVVTNPQETYPIKISPYKFDISQFGEKERSKLEFKIENVSESDVNVSLIDMDDKYFKVKLPSKIKAGGTESGEVEIYDEYINSEFEKSITIELNDPDHSRFTIPVKRTIRQLSNSGE